MKKLLCIFLCVFLLHGCETRKDIENEIPDFTGFKADVNTTINDVKISAKVEYMSFAQLVLTFSLPESADGMTIEFSNEEYIVTYDGLTFTMSKSGMPYSGICDMIRMCAENIKAATFDGICYTFSSDGHTYKLTMDEKNCFKTLTVDETHIINFENFEYIMGHTE